MLQPYASASTSTGCKCNVHARGARKTISAAHAAASATLAAAGLQATWFQEWPIRYGLQNQTVWIDLVFQLGERVYGIEVHGGKEHVHQPERRRKDALKQRLWLRQHGTTLVAIHSTENLKRCGLQHVDWAGYVREQVLAAVARGDPVEAGLSCAP